MRPDVVIHILKVLALCRDFKLPQPALFERVRIRAGEDLPHDLLLENVSFAESKGWLATDVNAFQTKRYWITQAGDIQLSGYV
jgi:hypothetical protein